MRPLSPPTNKGRTVAVDDVHHRTADQPRLAAKASAKALRHAARRHVPEIDVPGDEDCANALPHQDTP